MKPEQLKLILDRGDTDACLRFFAKATEAERRAVSKTALASLEEMKQDCVFKHFPGAFRGTPGREVKGMAVLASCSLDELKQRGMQWLPGWDHIIAVLADRRPDWIDDFADAVLDFSRGWWRLVRRMVHESLCRKPQTDLYVAGMICCLEVREPTETKTLRNDLLDHLDLLDDDIWRLFELEGTADFSLASHDRRSQPERRWDRTLIALSKEGRLPRKRLLDASLEALARDFRPYRARWFSRFHESLEPTDAERVERTDRYLALLSSQVSSTVSFTLKAVRHIDNIKPIDGPKLIEAIRPALHARRKGMVRSVLTLLGRLARRSPEVRSTVALTVADGLNHEGTDVQEAVLSFLERHGDCDDSQLAEAVFRHREHVAASLRGRLDSLIGVTVPLIETRPAEAMPDLSRLEASMAALDPELAELAGVDRALAALRNGIVDVTAIDFDGAEIPRLDPDAELQPIAELDELIDVCAAALEEPGRFDDVERAFDGISRLCAERPDDFQTRVSPLSELARRLLRRDAYPFVGWSPQGDLGGVILSWTTGGFSRPKRAKSSRGGTVWQWSAGKHTFEFPGTKQKRVLGFLSRRSLAIAERASRRDARPLLCAPTHAGGWIDPIALVERTKAQLPHRGRPEDTDRILALLRLAPDRRSEALCMAADLTDEFGQALRYALGDSRVCPGSKAALWVAAARARSPYGDDPALQRQYGQLGPDGALATKYAWEVEHVTKTYGGPYTGHAMHSYPFHLATEPEFLKGTDRNLVTVQFHRVTHYWQGLGGPTVDTVRWVATVWPIARESFFAAGARALSSNIDWKMPNWENRGYLEPLLDPDTPLKPMALLLLALGLAAKEPGEHGLAADVLAAAIEDGRVDDVELGEVMAQLLPTGLIKLARWAKTLGQVAGVSSLHAYVVRSAIERSLRGNPGKAPHGLHALLDVLKELVFEAGDRIRSEAARAFLRQVRGRGKAASTAKVLLGCEATAAAGHLVEIMPAVVQHRLERAARWTRRKRSTKLA